MLLETKLRGGRLRYLSASPPEQKLGPHLRCASEPTGKVDLPFVEEKAPAPPSAMPEFFMFGSLGRGDRRNDGRRNLEQAIANSGDCADDADLCLAVGAVVIKARADRRDNGR